MPNAVEDAIALHMYAAVAPLLAPLRHLAHDIYLPRFAHDGLVQVLRSMLQAPDCAAWILDPAEHARSVLLQCRCSAVRWQTYNPQKQSQQRLA